MNDNHFTWKTDGDERILVTADGKEGFLELAGTPPKKKKGQRLQTLTPSNNLAV